MVVAVSVDSFLIRACFICLIRPSVTLYSSTDLPNSTNRLTLADAAGAHSDHDPHSAMQILVMKDALDGMDADWVAQLVKFSPSAPLPCC
jgi:hypothetical protein